MLIPFSQAEVAFRDTLITKAEGTALDVLGRMYGFPRLGIFQRKYYRRALREVVYGKRGTYRLLFKVLEHLFDQYSERRGVINVTLDPAFPHSLVYREGGAPTFDCASVQRYVRVDSPTFGSKIYFSQGIIGNRLVLNPIDTPSIAGADWGTLAASEDATVKILGFMMRERHPGPPHVDGFDLNGEPWHPVSNSQDDVQFADETYLSQQTCTIDLYIDNFLWTTPPTYLQEDGTIDREVAAPNQPWGGHLMSLYDAANRVVIEYPASGVASEIHPEGGDQEYGPYPIYLDAEGRVAGAFIDLLDSLLASVVHLTAEIKDWCEEFNEGTFNPFGHDFDPLQNGIAQGLPENWDLEKNGVPRNVPNTEIEAAEHVNEYFIFEDVNGSQVFIEEQADLAISNEGKIILDSDTYYTLVTIINNVQSSVSVTPANDVLRVSPIGRISDVDANILATIPLATFVDSSGQDASQDLGTIAGTTLRTETANSGNPVIQEPGANRTDNDVSTPDTISRLLARTVDLFGPFVAGFIQLREANGDLYWSQDVKIVLDENRNLVTTTGIPLHPAITVSNGVRSVFIKDNGTVLEDTGNGLTSIGQINVGIFANPKGLLETDGDNILKESTAALQPIEHRRSGAPTVGAGFTTATRGRIKTNGIIGGGLIQLNGQNNRLQVVPV